MSAMLADSATTTAAPDISASPFYPPRPPKSAPKAPANSGFIPALFPQIPAHVFSQYSRRISRI
jgi:hypothetical protein